MVEQNWGDREGGRDWGGGTSNKGKRNVWRKAKANILDYVINGNWRKIMGKTAYVSVFVNNKDRWHAAIPANILLDSVNTESFMSGLILTVEEHIKHLSNAKLDAWQTLGLSFVNMIHSTQLLALCVIHWEKPGCFLASTCKGSKKPILTPKSYI